jgi:hypothetical protein
MGAHNHVPIRLGRQTLRLLGSVGHVLAAGVLHGGALAGELLLPELGLLLLLDEVADGAAAGCGDVGQAAALQVVLLADLRALDRLGDPVQAEHGGAEEEQALSLLDG